MCMGGMVIDANIRGRGVDLLKPYQYSTVLLPGGAVAYGA